MAIDTSSFIGNPASATYASLGGSQAVSKSSAAQDAQTKFLTLLTAQMQHQDPLNPMDNAQVTSQIAQLNTVDGIERLNAAVKALTANMNDSTAIQATGLVGKDVLVNGSRIDHVGTGGVGGVDLSAPADSVQVVIKDANGFPIKTVNLGALPSGVKSFSWDGKADNGQMSALGQYTMSVRATQGGQLVQATALETDRVASVTRSAGGVAINYSSGATSGLDQVKQFI